MKCFINIETASFTNVLSSYVCVFVCLCVSVGVGVGAFSLFARRVLLPLVVLGFVSLGIVSLPLFETESPKPPKLHVDPAHRQVNHKKKNVQPQLTQIHSLSLFLVNNKHRNRTSNVAVSRTT